MTIPTVLTLIRLVASLSVVPLFFPLLLTTPTIGARYLAGCIFLLISLTDYFDGYCARRFAQTSLIGAALDLVADKCLLLSTLVVLLAVHKINYLWVLLFLFREFLICGMRQMAVENGFKVGVSSWGKLKTFLLTGALFSVIISSGDDWVGWLAIALMMSALLCSYYSAIDYGMVFLRRYHKA